MVASSYLSTLISWNPMMLIKTLIRVLKKLGLYLVLGHICFYFDLQSFPWFSCLRHCEFLQVQVHYSIASTISVTSMFGK